MHRAGVVQLHFGAADRHSGPNPHQTPEARAIPVKPDLYTQFSRHARTAPISAEAARALRHLHTRSAHHVSPVLLLTAAMSAKSQGKLP
jgi:hypothetical protein